VSDSPSALVCELDESELSSMIQSAVITHAVRMKGFRLKGSKKHD